MAEAVSLLHESLWRCQALACACVHTSETGPQGDERTSVAEPHLRVMIWPTVSHFIICGMEFRSSRAAVRMRGFPFMLLHLSRNISRRRALSPP